MTPRELRPLSTYDISDLAQWVDQSDHGAAYVDPATGEIYPAFEGGAPIDENEEEVDLDETDWIAIGGSGSHLAYQDMEDFAEAVADPRAKRRLRDALQGRAPFRRFRDVMWELPEETGRAWNRYRVLGSELRAVGWLVEEGLVAAGEAAEASAEREAAQLLVLEAVGGGRRPRLILLNGMPGVGKSTLANRYVAEHPGVLACDPDRLRPMIGGDPAGSVEAVRTLALAMATAHLRTGHDVVLPQLVADDRQLQRFVDAAEEGGGELWMVMLHDDLADADRAARLSYDGAPGPRSALAAADAGEHLTRYADALERIALLWRCPEVFCDPDDIDASYRGLLAIVARPTRTGAAF